MIIIVGAIITILIAGGGVLLGRKFRNLSPSKKDDVAPDIKPVLFDDTPSNISINVTSETSQIHLNLSVIRQKAKRLQNLV